MCKTLGVSRSGFYAWMKRGESNRSIEDRELLKNIRRVHAESREIYGSPRVHAALRREGIACGENRVARLMREAGIRSKARRRSRVKTTDSNHSLPVAPNLIERDFSADGPNKLWVADITYIPTEEGWLYLASIVDVFSRMVVGWSMAAHMRTSLVLGALNMAIQRRSPAEGLIHHSDRGSQYASTAYRDQLEDRGIVCSMSAKGNCYDNALKESFFHSLKGEVVPDGGFQSRREARTAIFEYIEVFYNRTRLHSSLAFLPPEEFEARYIDAA